jgi:type II secretory pathway component PulF
MSYGPLREEILSIEFQVIAGKSLSSALTLFSNFSPITQRMIKIGEQSGTLGESLAQVHEYYAQDVKNNIERFMTFLEPGLLVVVGSVVTWIVMALFWPLYEVSSHLEGL